jgi:hypothetical protein
VWFQPSSDSRRRYALARQVGATGVFFAVKYPLHPGKLKLELQQTAQLSFQPLISSYIVADALAANVRHGPV